MGLPRAIITLAMPSERLQRQIDRLLDEAEEAVARGNSAGAILSAVGCDLQK